MAEALLFSPTNPHFFQPLCPGFQSHLIIPVKFFSEHIEGKHEGETVKLRSDVSERTWKVKREGHRLTNGWKEFVEAHSLRTGDFVVFRHEEDLLFHVTALGPSFCEIQYAPSGSRNEEEEEEEEESDETAEISSGSEKDAEGNQTKISKSSSFYFNCFSQFVTASNLSRDCVGVPTAFAKRNGLNKANQEMVLMNEEGKSWPSELKILASCRIVIVRGWTSFCTANKLEAGDSCTFRLLGNTDKPVFRLCSCTKAKKSQSAEESIADKAGENRFVMLTPTHNSLGIQMEQSPLEADAREHKRARVQNWSPKLETRENTAAEGEPSHRTRASNKSNANQGNFQDTQSSFVSEQLAKVKQSVVDTLTSIRGFRVKLETMEKKLEDSVQELHNLSMIL